MGAVGGREHLSIHREDTCLPGAEGMRSAIGTTCGIGTTDGDIQFWRRTFIGLMNITVLKNEKQAVKTFFRKVIVLKSCNASTLLALMKPGEECYGLNVCPLHPNS